MKNNKKMKIIFLSIWLSIISVCAVGQSFTLKQCVEYANNNNGNITNANYDVDIAQKKINEQIGSFLPQIEASGSYTDNLKLNTTVLPGDLMGQPGKNISVKMGTQHNVSGGVQLSQKIYDPTFALALKATKLNKDQMEQLLKQTREKIQYNVSTLYYQTLVIAKQKNTLQAALNSSKASLESTELRFKNGIARKIDVDKIRVSFNSTKSQFQQSELSYKQSLNNLKYSMGMPVDSCIILVDTTLTIDIPLYDTVACCYFIENRTDYQLQKIQLRVNEADKKRNISGYLPALSFNAYYGTNALRNEFDFFRSGSWYPNSYVGFSIKLPIFDGQQRHSRIAQSKLNIEKTKVSILQTEESIKVELSNSEIEYRNAIDNIHNEKSNLDLAESVFKSTQHQYQQGTSSALDLVQAESSFRESLNSYYNKLLNFYLARINLEQSKGTLSNYINNLK
jgi:outer membrane protein